MNVSLNYNGPLRFVPVVNPRSSAMIWLYRLQQRLSITRNESLAVLTLASLFLLGLTVRHIQEQQVPPLAVDSLVAQSAADTAAASAPEPATDAPSPSAETPINVNTASREALKALPDIGPALSKRIMTYRSTQQPFQRVDELERVSGIGPKTLASIRPMVRVSPPADTSR
jgi:competence protein ComEA